MNLLWEDDRGGEKAPEVCGFGGGYCGEGPTEVAGALGAGHDLPGVAGVPAEIGRWGAGGGGAAGAG